MICKTWHIVVWVAYFFSTCKEANGALAFLAAIVLIDLIFQKPKDEKPAQNSKP